MLDLKKKLTCVLSVILALTVILPACSLPGRGGQNGGSIEKGGQDAANRQAAEAKGQDAKTQAKGRYREEKISFPMPVETIFSISHEGEKVQILAEDEPGTFFLLESADGGTGWRQEELPADWLPPDYRVASACLGAEGSIFVAAGKMSEDPMDEKHTVGEYSYYQLKGQGASAQEGAGRDGAGAEISQYQASPLNLEIPETKEAYDEYGIRDLAASSEGKLYGMLSARKGDSSECTALCFDLEKEGAAAWSVETDMGSISLFGDRLYLNGHGNGVKELDASSGEKGKDLPIASRDFWHMDMLQGEKLFYCNESGIYGADVDLTFTELLVDGALSSFSDISYGIEKFCSVSEDVFLVFLEDNKGKIEGFRYEYDPELLTQPEKELKVYSLKDSNMARKLVADFQAAHPEAYIKYEVGMKEAGIKEADAINVLNTEIAAGSGPDVLVLDGLPWESYGEKGLLADMAQELEGELKEGKVFASVFSAYQKGDAQYVVPISFSIPVVVGERSVVSQINSLGDVKEAVAKPEGKSLAIQGFLPFVISVFWQEIEQEDGSISKEGLKKLLETGKEICDAVKEKGGDGSYFFDEWGDWTDEEGNVHNGEADISVPVWDVLYGNTGMGLGGLGTIRDFTAISDNVPGQDLGYQVIGDGVFHALEAGVNQQSGQLELAKEFLRFAISEEEQRAVCGEMHFPNEKFPVNQAVWEEMIKEPPESELEEYGDIFVRLGGEFAWPGKEAIEKLQEEIEGAVSPAMEDRVMSQMVLEGAKGYFDGEKGVDAAVNEIVQKVEVYLAE